MCTEFGAKTNQTTKTASKSRPSKRYRLREENTLTNACNGSVAVLRPTANRVDSNSAFAYRCTAVTRPGKKICRKRRRRHSKTRRVCKTRALTRSIRMICLYMSFRLTLHFSRVGRNDRGLSSRAILRHTLYSFVL